MVPTFVLHNGKEVPLVGLGCASGVRHAHVVSALKAGYRFLDTAQSYRWGYHEDEVGSALQQVLLDSSDPVFIQTKIHPQDLGFNSTKRAVEVSQERLGVSYIDSVLIHKPRCWSGACRKEPEGTWQDSWKALEELVDEGVIGAIGICDVDQRLFDELLRQRIKPHIIQNWMDPFHQEKSMREMCQNEGILFQGYSSLGTQWVHHRGYDKNPVLHDATLVAIAGKYEVSVPQVVIQWATFHGISVLPASTNAARQKANLQSFDFVLTSDEIAAIDRMDGNVPSSTSNHSPNEVAVSFENGGGKSIEAYWISDNQNEVLVGSVLPGHVLSLSSVHGHSFVFKAAGEVVAEHTVEKQHGSNQHHVVWAEHVADDNEAKGSPSPKVNEAAATDDEEEEEESSPSSKVLLAHTLIDSNDPTHPYKAGGLPQVISAKKAFRLFEETPLRYYAGTPRARMHLTRTTKDAADFYVWYAWKGSDVKRDGYFLQVFQIETDAKPSDIVSALHQFGELDSDNPFIVWTQETLWQYLFEFQKQKQARQEHGLSGVSIYLYPWKRIFSDNITEKEKARVAEEATTLVHQSAGWLTGAVRVRTLNATDPIAGDVSYISIEEESDLGNLYDTLVGWTVRAFGGGADKKWGLEWGRQTMYKFHANTTVQDRKFAMQSYHSGRLNSRKHLDRLFQMIWPLAERSVNNGSRDEAPIIPTREL